MSGARTNADNARGVNVPGVINRDQGIDCQPVNADGNMSCIEQSPERNPVRNPVVNSVSKATGWGWVSSGLLAVFDQGLVSLTSFLTMILMARFCSKAEVGVYALAWSLLNIARVVQERAIGAPYVVLVHQPQRHTAGFTASSLVHQTAMGFLSSLLFIGLAAGIFWFGNVSRLGVSLIFVALSLPFILMRDHLRTISGAHLRYGIAVALNGSALVLQVLLVWGLHVQGWLSASTAFACLGIASLMPAAVWLVIRPVGVRLDRAEVFNDLKATLAFSKWLVAARLFPTASAAMMPWIVYWYIGEGGAAALATCLALANISMLVIVGVNNFLQLRTVLGYHASGVGGMVRVMALSAVIFNGVLGPFVVALWIWGDWLMVACFGQEYAGYRQVIALLGLHTLLIAVCTIFGNGMSALGKPRGLFLGELGYAILAITAAYWLTEQYGLKGTAAALCVAAAGSAVIAAGCFIAAYRGEVAQRSLKGSIEGVA